MAFVDEVRQQGDSLLKMGAFYRSREGSELLARVRSVMGVSPRSILFFGMGSSEHVAHSVRDALAAGSGIPVVVRDAGELLHYGMQTIAWHDSPIGISQSGESIETRKVVEALQGHPRLMTITNDPDSTMARLSRLNLPLAAGEEAAISTATYSNSLGLLALIAAELTRGDIAETLSHLEEVAKSWSAWFGHRAEDIDAAAEFLRTASSLQFVARGPAIAAALQAALTFQEGVHIHASAMTGGSFRHGPIERAGPDLSLVVYAPADTGGDLLAAAALEAAEMGARVVLLTQHPRTPHPNLLQMEISSPEPSLFGLACAVPQELLLDRMAWDRGVQAGVFRHGGKITDRE